MQGSSLTIAVLSSSFFSFDWLLQDPLRKKIPIHFLLRTVHVSVCRRDSSSGVVILSLFLVRDSWYNTKNTLRASFHQNQEERKKERKKERTEWVSQTLVSRLRLCERLEEREREGNPFENQEKHTHNLLLFFLSCSDAKSFPISCPSSPPSRLCCSIHYVSSRDIARQPVNTRQHRSTITYFLQGNLSFTLSRLSVKHFLFQDIICHSCLILAKKNITDFRPGMCSSIDYNILMLWWTTASTKAIRLNVNLVC
jgi:hypothetical protein